MSDLILPALYMAATTRRGFLKAELRLGNQIKAIERRWEGGAMRVAEPKVILPLPPTEDLDPTTSAPQAEDVEVLGGLEEKASDRLAPKDCLPSSNPLVEELERHRAGLAASRRDWDRRISKLALQLPISTWAAGVRGLGPLSLGLIVAELGDPGAYANPAKLWKRMGLAVIDGKSQRKVEGGGALEQGYSPRRRALMHVVGENLLRQNRDGKYRTLYNERKAIETGESPMHIHRKALRHSEKQLLVDLWREWQFIYDAQRSASTSPEIEVAS